MAGKTTFILADWLGMNVAAYGVMGLTPLDCLSLDD
jgi:hypothetical protein